jgi:hypothetical protein
MYEIWVYAHDAETYRILNLLDLQNVKVVSTDELLTHYIELERSRKDKSYMELIYAMTPFMIMYAAEKTTDSVWYIDADVYFLKPFSNLENQIENMSILVSAHNFPSRLKFLEKYGKYNVGIIYVSGDQESLDLLQWWANQCIQDTSTFSNADVYGDQKYLDEFPIRNTKFGSFEPTDCCAAPWNIEVVKNFPPITFHFSGLRRYKYFSYLGLSTYTVQAYHKYKADIYRPYNNQLDKIEKEIFGRLKIDTRRLSRRSLLKMIFCRDALIRFPD